MIKNTPVGWGWAGKSYAGHLWQTYRLTLEGFNKLWDKQNGRCRGCGGAFAHPTRKMMEMGLRPEVDHSHKTGIVRGLLCRRCNDFLGKINDNRESLRNLEAYLREAGEGIE